jgi:hypothetical protein
MSDGTRRSRHVVLTGLAAAASLMAVFAMTGEPPAPVAVADTGQPASPGWRWEWYGAVEVQVPDDWGYGTTGSPPCLHEGRKAKPYVGRPGVVPSIGCTEPVAPLALRGPHLWFDSPAFPGVRTFDGGWVEETRSIGGIALTILSDDDALRARIFGTARPATGGSGCPAEHAVGTEPGYRPDPGQGGLATMGRVETITICRYALGDERRPPPASRVLSAGRLTGEDARALLRAIEEAPEGSGPNEPQNCLPEVAAGHEVMLLLVRDNARVQEVVVRYSGCDFHGTDDGHARHRLTTAVLRPLLTGPHAPTVLNGAVADLIWL